MIYDADNLSSASTCIDGRWVVARPVSHKHESFLERLRDAWLVLTRKADGVKFYKQ
ncbi:MAG: hypothetical protein QNJ46_05925 [Leptolyngbyaceae cyanobacterium MO_188.B28]|nr:hypothetical protein [Leptolyngbyaceae cyanobacterium MO_188.B28]